MRDESSIITENFREACRPRIYASSIIGTRKYQQDSYAFIATDKGSIAVVCDGMGGLEGGEKASRTAVNVLMTDFLREVPVSSGASFFYKSAVKADQRVYRIADRNGKPLGAGTTMVSVLINGNMLHWLSVGDSKIYLIRNNAMHCLVREHNYRQMLNEHLQSGRITPEKYRQESVKADALTSFIGIGELKLIEINHQPFELLDGDVILLCSDGLYRSLKETQILAIIKDNYFDYGRAVKVLTDTALRYSKGSQDNTTAVVVNYCSEVPALF